jgi:hypothetical protein
MVSWTGPCRAEVLAEICELLVDVSPNIPAVHDPGRDACDPIEFFDVRLFHDPRLPIDYSPFLY